MADNDYEYKVFGNTSGLEGMLNKVMRQARKEEKTKTVSTEKKQKAPVSQTRQVKAKPIKKTTPPQKRTRKPKEPPYDPDKDVPMFWFALEARIVAERKARLGEKEETIPERPLYSFGIYAAYFVDLYEKFTKLEENYELAKIQDDEEWLFSYNKTSVGLQIYNDVLSLDRKAFSSLSGVKQFIESMEENKCIVRDEKTKEILGLSYECDTKKYFEENGFDRQNPEGKFADSLKEAEGYISEMLALRPTLDFWFRQEMDQILKEENKNKSYEDESRRL